MTSIDLDQLAELLAKAETERLSREEQNRKALWAGLEPCVVAAVYEMRDIFPELGAPLSMGFQSIQNPRRACQDGWISAWSTAYGGRFARLGRSPWRREGLARSRPISVSRWPGTRRATTTWCVISSRSSAPRSARTPPARPESATRTASATTWRGPTAANRTASQRPAGGRQTSDGARSPDAATSGGPRPPGVYQSAIFVSKEIRKLYRRFSIMRPLMRP